MKRLDIEKYLKEKLPGKDDLTKFCLFIWSLGYEEGRFDKAVEIENFNNIIENQKLDYLYRKDIKRDSK